MSYAWGNPYGASQGPPRKEQMGKCSACPDNDKKDLQIVWYADKRGQRSQVIVCERCDCLSLWSNLKR
jgi:hypothetical protein